MPDPFGRKATDYVEDIATIFAILTAQHPESPFEAAMSMAARFHILETAKHYDPRYLVWGYVKYPDHAYGHVFIFNDVYEGVRQMANMPPGWNYKVIFDLTGGWPRQVMRWTGQG